MNWICVVQKIGKDYHKVIYNNELNEVLMCVDNLSEDIIADIITSHNKEVDKVYRKGIKEGREIVKDVYGV